jgi:PAS domain S-box-containing protein
MNDKEQMEQALRKKAEEISRTTAQELPANLDEMSTGEVRLLLHELRVHQIELEMQNAELRRTRDELEIERRRYFDLYDLAPVGYCTVSEEGLLLEANLAAINLLGVTRNTLPGQRMSQFILEEEQNGYYLFRKDLFASGQPQSCELRMVKKDGTLFSAHLAAVLAGGVSGAPVCRIVLSDISERKRAEGERVQLEAQLRQAQKMESVGLLAGGVAHDFNNKLAIILGYTEMILGKVAPTEPFVADLQEIQKAAEHSADLTRQLLAFARKQVIMPRILDLNDTIEGMLRMLRRLIGEDIDLTWQPAADLWPVKIDPSQIDQILANLCVNGRDAIGGVGRLTIETANCTLNTAYCERHIGAVPGEYVLLSVADNGCGMDRETLARIFEPFFTTKTFGEGTGLGLATVYGAVKQNNGFIDVDSRPGVGTTFSIFLPRHRIMAVPELYEAAARPTESGRETILLVEDEEAILRLTTRMLLGLGYQVLAANSPGEAIRLAKVHAPAIHLLMTDVVMPGMNGRDLCEHLLSFMPQLKCLFMSGYTAEIIARQEKLDTGLYFIGKPFTKKELAAKIRTALAVDDGSSGGERTETSPRTGL